MAKLSKELIDAAFELANGERSKLGEKERELFGLTSTRVKAFLNNLCSTPETNYLELGIYKGSTILSAMYGNPTCFAIGVDNFKYDERESKRYPPTGFIWENMKSQLEANIARYMGPTSEINTNNLTIVQEDFQKVDWKNYPKIDVCFFDITPATETTYNEFFEKVIPALNLNSVIIFSNYSNVKNAKDLDQAISTHSDKFTIKHKAQKISGGLSDATQFYSGLLVLLITKKANIGK